MQSLVRTGRQTRSCPEPGHYSFRSSSLTDSLFPTNRWAESVFRIPFLFLSLPCPLFNLFTCQLYLLGWARGFEPPATWATAKCSATELRPPPKNHQNNKLTSRQVKNIVNSFTYPLVYLLTFFTVSICARGDSNARPSA